MNSQVNFNDEDFEFDYMKVIQRDDSDSRSLDLDDINTQKFAKEEKVPRLDLVKNDNSLPKEVKEVRQVQKKSSRGNQKPDLFSNKYYYGIDSDEGEEDDMEIIDINRDTIYEHTVFDEDEDLSEDHNTCTPRQISKPRHVRRTSINKEGLYEHTVFDEDHDLSDDDPTYVNGKKIQLVKKSDRKPVRIKGSNYASMPLAKKNVENEENILPEDMKDSAAYGDMFVPISFEIIEDGFLIKSFVKITFWKFSIGTRVHEIKLEEVTLTRKVTLYVDGKEIYSNYE